jgi:hypothetical protein
MPEQKQGYMAELDQWSEATILNPLHDAWRDLESAPDEFVEDLQKELDQVVAAVKRAIREKVLESYRNGQQAGPRASGSQPAEARRRQYKQQK